MERWTVRNGRSGQYHAHINSGGRFPSSWGKFDYCHTFDPDVETVDVVHPVEIDARTREHFPSIKKGIERCRNALREQGQMVTSLMIDITRIDHHPPDFDLVGSSHGMRLLLHLIEKYGQQEPPLDPAWLTPTAVALAREMDERREFASIPILADALQDAGCDNEDLLSHCRGGGPHVRGCWVVDAILGKD